MSWELQRGKDCRGYIYSTTGGVSVFQISIMHGADLFGTSNTTHYPFESMESSGAHYRLIEKTTSDEYGKKDPWRYALASLGYA